MAFCYIVRKSRTIRARLKRLAAVLAAQIADAHLLIDFNGDRGFVRAEDAFECNCKRLALGEVSVGRLSSQAHGKAVPSWDLAECATTSCVFPETVSFECAHEDSTQSHHFYPVA